MGQQTSSSIEEGNQSHERLGVIRVYQTQNFLNQYENPCKIQLKKPFQSQNKYQKWLTQLRSIDTEGARDVLYLPSQFKYQTTGLCGSSGNVILNFDHFPYVLKTQIKNRRKMAQYFQETQLWYLMYNLVEAGAILQRKNKKIGDVHPNNCLLNQNGLLKIISLYSIPNQTTNYDKIVQSPTNDAYLAPQQIDQILLQKGIYPNVDPFKAQVFSIGVTLLQAATLEDCFYVYNRGPYKINRKKINELLKIIKEKYGNKFNQFMNNMLQEMPKRRKGCSQIYQQLYPFEQAILELRPFDILNEAQNSTFTKTTNFNPFNQQSTINGNGYGHQTHNQTILNGSSNILNINSNGFRQNMNGYRQNNSLSQNIISNTGNVGQNNLNQNGTLKRIY